MQCTDLEQTLGFLQRLIACDSKSSDLKSEDRSNKALILFVKSVLEGCGYCCSVTEVVAGKYNLYACLEPKLPCALLLSGHSDTVPASKELWHSDPLVLTSRNGRLHGLGCSDMKGALACFLSTACSQALLYKKSPESFAGSLDLLFTCDEETSMAGARAFAEHSKRVAALCLVGEPTAGQPIIAHKGYAARILQVRGRSGHSSDPASGLNAIYGMAQAVCTLNSLAHNFARRSAAGGWSIPYTTLNCGMVEGGNCINQICDRAQLSFEIRPLEALLPQEIDGLVLNALSSIKEQGFDLKLSTPYADIPCLEQEESALLKQVAGLCGKPCLKVNYCTEASLLKQVCSQVAVLGPGDIARAHQADEYILPAELAEYNVLLGQICALQLRNNAA